MKESKWEELYKDLRNRVYHPFYLLMGEEPFFIDVISKYIEENVLSESEREFNQSILYGRETDVSTVISIAKRYPMMAQHHVVIVKEAQNLRDIENLESYLLNPLLSTILVICYKYKTVDKRKNFYRNASKIGVVLESKRLYDNEMPGWIAGFVKRNGFRINEKAAQLLADYLGTDLGKVVNELKKIFISLSKGAEINPEIIEQNTGLSKDFNVFELQDALGKKDTFKAFQIVKYFADNPKSNPIVLTLGLLYSYFVKLLVYHSLKDKSPRNVASELKISPFFVHGLQKAAANYSIPKLMDVFSELRVYDLRSKGVNNNSTPHSELLKELVFKILN